jgi:hypothetical protein
MSPPDIAKSVELSWRPPEVWLAKLPAARLIKPLNLMGLAAGPKRPQLAAERHSQKRAAFPGLESGPVKGMTF